MRQTHQPTNVTTALLLDCGTSNDGSLDGTTASTSSVNTATTYTGLFSFVNDAYDLGYRVCSPEPTEPIEASYRRGNTTLTSHRRRRRLNLQPPSFERSTRNDAQLQARYRRFSAQRKLDELRRRFGVVVDVDFSS